MFDKTSSLAYQDFGGTLKRLPSTLESQFYVSTQTIGRNCFQIAYVCNHDIYITCSQGSIVALVVFDETEEKFQPFIIHRVTKIKKGLLFNVCGISSNGQVTFYIHKDCHISIQNVKTPYVLPPVKPTLSISQIYAYYYEIRNPGYQFKGEQHPFWELTFVDNGTLQVSVDDEVFNLKTYDCFFFTPNQFHRECNISDEACSYVTLMFDGQGLDPDKFKNKIFHLTNHQYETLSELVQYTSLNDISVKNDLILASLYRFMCLLIAQDEQVEYESTHMPVRQKSDDPLLNEVIDYINTNIFRTLSIDDLCHQFSMSRSSLQTLFHSHFAMAPKQYINELKLNRACLMIREGKYNISEISNALGFASIHYFSRKFKQYYHVSPSEYVKKIYHQ